MLTVEALVAALTLLAAALAAITVRRRWLAREGGAVEMSFRLKRKTQGRGWVLGVGRFEGDELQWFRVFSFSTRPRRTLNRRGLEVRARRAPKGPESLALQKGMEVVELRSRGTPVEIALDTSAMTGFLAWLESLPPGANLPG